MGYSLFEESDKWQERPQNLPCLTSPFQFPLLIDCTHINSFLCLSRVCISGKDIYFSVKVYRTFCSAPCIHMLLDSITIIYSNTTRKIAIMQSVLSCPNEQKKSKLWCKNLIDPLLILIQNQLNWPFCTNRHTVGGKHQGICSSPLPIHSFIHLHMLLITSWGLIISGTSIHNGSILSIQVLIPFSIMPPQNYFSSI